MSKILTLEQLISTPINDIISLYSQDYKLSEKSSYNIYPNIDDIIPHSRSGYNFASTNLKFSFDESIEIGNVLNIDWKKINPNEFYLGINIELEHGLINPSTNITNNDPILTGKIALAHLNEDPYYYYKNNVDWIIT